MSTLLDAANTGLNALFFWRYLECSDNSLNLPVCFKAEKMVVARAAPGENMRTLSTFSMKLRHLPNIKVFPVWKRPCHVPSRSLPHSHSRKIKARHASLSASRMPATLCLFTSGAAPRLPAPTLVFLWPQKHLKMQAARSAHSHSPRCSECPGRL